MRRFWLKFISICAAVAVVMSLFEVLSYSDDYSMPVARITDSDTYLTHMDGPDWIVPLIKKVQKDDGSEILLLGDSVCRQMFMDVADINEEVCVVPAISPFTMCGQYILTKLYLDNHRDATDVYLIMVPMDDVMIDFDIGFAYQYVVMPLVETDTLDMLDPDTVNELTYLFGEEFMRSDIVRKVDNSGLNRKLYLNYVKKHVKNDYEHSLEDSVYIRYLKKIKKLCDDNGVRLHFMPAPVPDMDTYHEITDNLAPAYFAETGLDEIFPDYLGMVKYYPEEMFSDGVHFGGKYDSREEYNKIIREMYGATGLVDHLNLGD